MGLAGRRRGRAGFTLSEILIAMGLLATLLFSIGFALDRAADSYDEEKAGQALEAQAHRVLDFITRELLDANSDGLDPEPTPAAATETLTYQRFVGGATPGGPERTIALELEAGELDDGLDNNGNDLVDERVVVWTEDLGGGNERRKVLSHWVREYLAGEVPNAADDNGNGMLDELGLVFEEQGDVVRVRLTLERAGPGGNLVARTVETAVRVRN